MSIHLRQSSQCNLWPRDKCENSYESHRIHKLRAYNINEIELESQSQTTAIINRNDINCNGNNPHAYTAEAKAKINKACSALKIASLLILSDVSNCIQARMHLASRSIYQQRCETAWRLLITSEWVMQKPHQFSARLIYLISNIYFLSFCKRI